MPIGSWSLGLRTTTFYKDQHCRFQELRSAQWFCDRFSMFDAPTALCKQCTFMFCLEMLFMMFCCSSSRHALSRFAWRDLILLTFSFASCFCLCPLCFCELRSCSLRVVHHIGVSLVYGHARMALPNYLPFPTLFLGTKKCWDKNYISCHQSDPFLRHCLTYYVYIVFVICKVYHHIFLQLYIIIDGMVV